MLDAELFTHRPVRVAVIRLKTMTGQQFIIEPTESGDGLVIKADRIFAQGGKPGELLIMTVKER